MRFGQGLVDLVTDMEIFLIVMASVKYSATDLQGSYININDFSSSVGRGAQFINMMYVKIRGPHQDTRTNGNSCEEGKSINMEHIS